MPDSFGETGRVTFVLIPGPMELEKVESRHLILGVIS